MNLASVFSRQASTVNLKARNREQVLTELAGLTKNSQELGPVSTQTVARALTERESQGSTGFGDGIAIPHARIPGMNDFMLYIAHSPRGVDFDALDKKKVRLFFVILGPDNRPGDHIQILATLSRMLSGTTLKSELLAASSTDIMAESFFRHFSGSTETQTSRTPKIHKKQELKLLVLILYLEDLIYTILEYFLEQDIEGATVIESTGMGRYVSNIPVFASFIGFINENKTRSHTIMATIPADREEEIVKGIESITGNMDKKQGAMLMTLNIGLWKGSMKML